MEPFLSLHGWFPQGRDKSESLQSDPGCHFQALSSAAHGFSRCRE